MFLPDEPPENVWGPRENVSPGPAVALDWSGLAGDCMWRCFYINTLNPHVQAPATISSARNYSQTRQRKESLQLDTPIRRT